MPPETTTDQEPEIVQSQRQLQDKVGMFPRVIIEKFRNWGRTQEAVVLAVRPRCLQDIQKIVVACRQLGLRIRCVGYGHSWSPLFSDENNVLMQMDALKPEEGQPAIKLNTVGTHAVERCESHQKFCIGT